jgi:hypothetical protein
VIHEPGDAVARGTTGEPVKVVSLARVDLIGQVARRHADTSLVWADMVGLAGSNARLISTYLTWPWQA